MATDPLLMLKRRSKLVLAMLVLGVVGGVVYFLFWPPKYEATLRLIPAQPASPLAGLAQGNEILGDINLAGAGGTTGNRVAGVLQSQSVADAVIQKLDLVRNFHAGYIEKARLTLWARCSVAVDKKSDLVTLTCEDEAPTLAAAMATELGNAASEAFQRVSTTSASNERRFLETQLVDSRKRLDAASKALREFSERNRIVDIEEQARGVVSAIASLEGQRISKELELAYQQVFASSQESGALQLREQLAVIEKKLRDLVDGAGKDSHGMFPPAMTLPSLRFEFEALYREQKVQEAIYFVLTQRLELARAEEAKERSAFQVLDAPSEPTFRSWPQWPVIPIGAVIGLLLGVVIVVVPPWWRDLGRRASEPT